MTGSEVLELLMTKQRCMDMQADNSCPYSYRDCELNIDDETFREAIAEAIDYIYSNY